MLCSSRLFTFLFLTFQSSVSSVFQELFKEDFESGACTAQYNIENYKSIKYKYGISHGNFDVYKCNTYQYQSCCVQLTGNEWGTKVFLTEQSLTEGNTYYVDFYAQATRKWSTLNVWMDNYFHFVKLMGHGSDVNSPVRFVVPFLTRTSNSAVQIKMFSVPYVDDSSDWLHGVQIDNLILGRCDTDHYIATVPAGNDLSSMGCQPCKTTNIANLGGCLDSHSVKTCDVIYPSSAHNEIFSKITCNNPAAGHYLDLYGISHSCQTDDIANMGNCAGASAVLSCPGPNGVKNIVCSSCKNGFSLNNVNACVCGTESTEHCVDYVDDNLFCTATGQKLCEQCKTAYYLNYDKLSCIACGSGSYVTDTNECLQCSESIDYCETFSENCTNLSPYKTCLKCLNGFYKDNTGDCQPCDLGSGCKEADLAEECIAGAQASDPLVSVCKNCQLGFELINGKCSQCAPVNSCAFYEYSLNQCGIGNKNTCAVCKAYFDLDRTSNTCKYCNDDDNCIAFKDNCILNTEDNVLYKECIQCNVGLNLNTTTNMCDSCLENIENCSKFTNICDPDTGRYYCEQCDPTFFLNFDGLSCKTCDAGYYVENNICKPCKFDVSNCKDYDLVNGCGFSNVNEASIELSCLSCEPGFYLNNSKKCDSCFTNTEFCNEYLNECNNQNTKICASCQEKYFLSDVNICSKCEKNVDQCGRYAQVCNAMNKTDCLECATGYYLSNTVVENQNITECNQCTDVIDNCVDYFQDECSSLSSSQKRCKKCDDNMALFFDNTTSRWVCSVCVGIVIDGLDCRESVVDNSENTATTNISAGAIAGIVISVIVMIIVISVGIFYWSKRNEKMKREKELYGMSAKEFVMASESVNVLMQTDEEYNNMKAVSHELETSSQGEEPDVLYHDIQYHDLDLEVENAYIDKTANYAEPMEILNSEVTTEVRNSDAQAEDNENNQVYRDDDYSTPNVDITEEYANVY